MRTSGLFFRCKNFRNSLPRRCRTVPSAPARGNESINTSEIGSRCAVINNVFKFLAEIASLRDKPEPFSITSSGNDKPCCASQA